MVAGSSTNSKSYIPLELAKAGTEGGSSTDNLVTNIRKEQTMTHAQELQM